MSFWNGEKLLEALPTLIEPFDARGVDCAAYTLSIGSEIYISPSEQATSTKEQTIRQLDPQEAFLIPAGQFAFLLTQEIVTMPAAAIGFISMKASIKFHGLVNVSGFHVDPGYKGRLVFAVYNAGPVPVHLKQGQACFLIWYADLNAPSERVKSGDPVLAIASSHINGISGELHSFESLSKKIKDVDKTLGERIHKIEVEGATYKIVAGIFLALAVTFVGGFIKDCATKLATSMTQAPAPSSSVNPPAPSASATPLAPPAPSPSASSPTPSGSASPLAPAPSAPSPAPRARTPAPPTRQP
jgi:dCTP deaminase